MESKELQVCITLISFTPDFALMPMTVSLLHPNDALHLHQSPSFYHNSPSDLFFSALSSCSSIFANPLQSGGKIMPRAAASAIPFSPCKLFCRRSIARNRVCLNMYTKELITYTEVIDLYEKEPSNTLAPLPPTSHTKYNTC